MNLRPRQTRAIALTVSLLFLLLISWAYYRGRVWPMLIPAAILAVWFFLARLDDVLTIVAFCTPFSVDVTLAEGMRLALPTEPMMIFFSAIFFFRVLADPAYYDRRLLRHHVSIALLLSLTWMLFTSFFSHDIWVSIKYWLARLWFVLPFFFAATRVFCNPKRIRQFIAAYCVALVVIIAITTYRTLGNFHDLQVLHRVMKPFYNDHTAYGCVTALFLPVTVYLIFEKDAPWLRRFFFLAITVALAVGLGLSYCRAAWISLAGAIGLFFLIRIGMNLRWILLLMAVGIGVFFVHQSEILYNLGKNKQDSSLTLSGQLQSISNISTDASNLERLNRWACAFRMFDECPVTGYGPGTYQFFYGSHQRSYQLSTISTNAGDLGNAHSEYIGPLAEQGVAGLLLILAVFLSTFATGVRVYRTAADSGTARLALALTLCLTTYYIHGIFNNFLDTDKLSVPFWAFTAAVVALDHISEKRTLPEKAGEA